MSEQTKKRGEDHRLMMTPSGTVMRVWIEGDSYYATPFDDSHWSYGVVEPVCHVSSSYLDDWVEVTETDKLDAICSTLRRVMCWSDSHSSPDQVLEYERRVRNENVRNGFDAAARLCIKFIDEVIEATA